MSLPLDRPELEGYVCVSTLGRGQFGVAFLMQPTVPDAAELVVKRIDLSAMSVAERTEARKEVEVLKRLRDHAHIVEYLSDWTSDETTLYIAMGYANGGTLQRYLSDAKERSTYLSEELIAEWLRELLLALAFIHERRVLHRDLKTANIFLHNDSHFPLPFPTLKLGDFGIARVLSNSTSMASTVCGTPYYLSPELINGEAYHSPSDVWALGVVIYECAALQRPFEGDNIGSVAMAVMRRPHAPLPAAARYSAELSAIVDSMLHKVAKERADVDSLLNGEYVAAARARQLARVQAVVAGVEAEEAGLVNGQLADGGKGPRANERGTESPGSGRESALSASRTRVALSGLARATSPALSPSEASGSGVRARSGRGGGSVLGESGGGLPGRREGGSVGAGGISGGACVCARIAPAGQACEWLMLPATLPSAAEVGDSGSGIGGWDGGGDGGGNDCCGVVDVVTDGRGGALALTAGGQVLSWRADTSARAAREARRLAAHGGPLAPLPVAEGVPCEGVTPAVVGALAAVRARLLCACTGPQARILAYGTVAAEAEAAEAAGAPAELRLWQWEARHLSAAPAPAPVRGLPPRRLVLRLACGDSHCLALVGAQPALGAASASAGACTGWPAGGTERAGSAVGSASSAALRARAARPTGEVFSWGRGDRGQLGHHEDEDDGELRQLLRTSARGLEEARQVDSLAGEEAIEIACGAEFSAVLVNGGRGGRGGDEAVCLTWGANECGQLGHRGAAFGSDVWVPQPAELPAGCAPVSLACADSHMAALTSDGEILCWGNGQGGRLGRHASTILPWPIGAADAVDSSNMPPGVGVLGLVAVRALTVALLADGSAFAWGATEGASDGAAFAADVPTRVRAPAGDDGLGDGDGSVERGELRACCAAGDALLLVLGR